MINTKIKVGNYYADKSKNLPDTFYQQIIELENVLMILINVLLILILLAQNVKIILILAFYLIWMK